MSAKWPLSMSSTAPIVRTVGTRKREREVEGRSVCVVDIVVVVVD